MTEADYCPETGDQPRDSLTRRDLVALREVVERIQGGPLRKHVLTAAMELLERQEAGLKSAAERAAADVLVAVNAEREHWGDYLSELADQYFEFADLAHGLRAAAWRIKRG